MRIWRSIQEPVNEVLDYDERINGDDKGLINAWQVGRRLAERDPEVAAKARNGELPVLGVKGGVERKINAEKTGSLWYLAQWQGLRGDDLDIDMDAAVTMVCSRTGMKVLYTLDINKLFSVKEVSE